MAIRGPEGFRTHISKKVGCIDVDVCQKINFNKTFSSFLIIFHLQRGLFRPKGRSPTRASVRTQASEIKRRESRNAFNEKPRVLRQRCDGVEQAKREQSGSAPTSERRQTRPRLRGDSGLARPPRRGQKHARRERVRRCSRSRKRTVAFAAAGRNLRKLSRTSKKK